MTFRSHIQKLLDERQITTVSKEISKTFEVPSVLKQLEPTPVLFEDVRESGFRIAGNLMCSKQAFADYFGIQVDEIIPMMTAAIEDRSKPTVVETAPCQEVIDLNPDLDMYPIPLHFEDDGGNYITAGVVAARHPEHGQNLDFHRFMQISNTEMSVRIVRSRDFDTFLTDLGKLDAAICIGNSPNIMAAAATSVEIGIDELEIANTLEPLSIVKAHTIDVYVPAECEFVIEGTVYADRRHGEGPFVDLTETQDIIREEPVFVVKAITHRKDAIWQALLPGALEHKLLMGMPREPTIFRKVNEVVKCLDVNINPGGASWLHAIVQIKKENDDDARKAILAAFQGHRSCKHVFVVDEDIDIYNPLEVEWAMATRFQGDRDMLILDPEPGSSLDPSAEPGTKHTTKIGFDLTKPVGEDKKNYEKVDYPAVDLEDFLP